MNQQDIDEIIRLKALTSNSSVKNFLEASIKDFQDRLTPPPQKKEKEKEPNDSLPQIRFSNISNFMWDQEGKNVSIYIPIDDIGKVSVNNIDVCFHDTSITVKVLDLNGKNLRFAVPQLFSHIDPNASSYQIRRNRIALKLQKGENKFWTGIHHQKLPTLPRKPLKEKSASADTLSPDDPTAGLLNIMKKLYEEGDDEMKRTIAKSWMEGKDKVSKGDNSMPLFK